MTRLYLREAHLTYRRTDVKLGATRIQSSETVVRTIRQLIGSNIAESMVVIAMDTGNGMIGVHEVSRGAVNGCVINAADVFRYPLIVGAAAVVLAHNHPSGRVEPSADDIAITEKLCAAGKLLGIPVLDHVIVTDAGHFSFLDAGLTHWKESV
jgi:DNA repair protein RadC